MARLRPFLTLMITNITNGKTLVKRHKTYKSVFLKAKGLMFTCKKPDFGLVFEFNSESIRSLHMFFVFYPIDVLFLDKNRRIVEIKENFRPFTFYMPRRKSKYIVELPNGRASACRLGDTINFA